jgi:isopentenyl diphosphate isomerase/L-lactate dehydrogenase-like FMN-dependent dehydrogenase
MIGKLLAEGTDKLKEIGLGNYANKGAETGSSLKITRQYMDSLTIETRTIDAVEASTKWTFLGESFATPVMTGALSGLGAICPDPMVEMAKGVKAAGSAIWVGIGKGEELKAIIETGAKTIKIIKPYRDRDLIFTKLAEAEKYGAIAVGMDTIFAFGGKREDTLIRPDLMGPKTLADIREFVAATRLPFILKGILSEQDAGKALEAGAAAIVVSHHGGAVLDYAVPPLKILPRIAKVVDGKIPIFVDSGITRGTDVFKALALGADGVLIGRSVMAGLAVGGAEGVTKLIAGTNEELRRVMSLTGCCTLGEISSELVWA